MDFLKWLWRKWLPIAHAIGNFQAQVILSIFYVVVLLPVGVMYRFFTAPFDLKKNSRSSFGVWDHPKENLETARKQY